MTGKKRVENCGYCGAEMRGYEGKRYHKRICPKANRDAAGNYIDPGEEVITAEIIEDSPPILEEEMPAIEPELPPEEPPETEPEAAPPAPPQIPAGSVPDAMPDIPPAPEEVNISEAVKRASTFEARLSNLESELTALPAALAKINEVVQQVPDLVHQSVQVILNGGIPPEAGGNGGGPPAPPPAPGSPTVITDPHQLPPAGGRSNLGGDLLNQLGIGNIVKQVMSTIDMGELLTAVITKKYPNTPAGAIAQMIFGNKQKIPLATAGNMKFFTRGVQQAQTSIRMKNVDPTAASIAIKTQAEQMLNDKENPLTASDTMYWKGRLAEADSFLAMKQLRQIEEAPPPAPEPPAPAE